MSGFGPLAAGALAAAAAVLAVARPGLRASRARRRLHALPPPRHRRFAAPVRGAPPGRGGARDRGRAAGTVASRAVAALGRGVRTGAGRPADGEADARLGRALLAGAVAGAALGPVAGGAAGLGAWALPALHRRRAERSRHRAVVDALPDAADLLRVAVGAGLTVPLAVAAATPHLADPFAAALAEVARRVRLGARWAEALAALHDLGEPARPLATALIAAERDGAPVRGPLDQVAADARLARRRAAEEDARRLPVQLLFPLVLCTLPAFGLLTVVPLVAGTLGSLSL